MSTEIYIVLCLLPACVSNPPPLLSMIPPEIATLVVTYTSSCSILTLLHCDSMATSTKRVRGSPTGQTPKKPPKASRNSVNDPQRTGWTPSKDATLVQYVCNEGFFGPRHELAIAFGKELQAVWLTMATRQKEQVN